MIATVRLAALLLRREGRRGGGSLALTAVGVAVATTVALLVLSVHPALGDRADRIAWRQPQPIDDPSGAVPVALQVRDTELFADQRIDRVDLAPLAEVGADRPLPAPPGLERFPAPGEVWVSPALAALVSATPADQLGDRFPSTVTGTIDDDGLAHPDELVAVVGWAPADTARWTASRSDVVAIAGFATEGDDLTLDLYRQLAALASVLLAVPALLLIGSAARLTAARRDQRLAALRLAGASPSSVVGLAAIETGLAALAGAVAGAAAYLLLLPAASHIALAGGTWTPDQLRLGAPTLAMAVVAVPVLAATDAAIALRKVVISPLGVRSRARGRRPSVLRFGGLAISWLLLIHAARAMRGEGDLAPVLLGLGGVIAGVSLVGPWLAWGLGALLARVARRPSTLLAGRRIVDDPKGAFRAVSGVVLAGLVAGFLFGVTPTIDAAAGAGAFDGRAVVVAELPPGTSPGRVADVAASIERLGADVSTSGSGDGSPELRVSFDTSTVDPAKLEQARTLAATTPGVELREGPVVAIGDRLLLEDLRRASFIVSMVALALATIAGAVSSAGSILDQRSTLARLRLSGTPISLLQRARAWQAALPLASATVLSVGCGAAAGLVLLVAFGAPPERVVRPDVVPMAMVVLGGLLGGLVASAATRPVLLAATSRPLDDR